MTPHQHKKFLKKEEAQAKLEQQKKAEAWLPPPLWSGRLLAASLEEMRPFKLNQEDVPFIIKLIENPKYDIGLFAGNVDLFSHDCIHLLLGRGVMLKDEAFVIGYTMGSTKKMHRWRRNLFMFCARRFYPEGYIFQEEERFVFNLGVAAGYNCNIDLSTVNFNEYLDKSLLDIRGEFNIGLPLLKSCYDIEMKLFPNSCESQRLFYHGTAQEWGAHA